MRKFVNQGFQINLVVILWKGYHDMCMLLFIMIATVAEYKRGLKMIILLCSDHRIPSKGFGKRGKTTL